MPCGDGPSGNPKPKQHRLEVPFLRSAPFSECLPGITQDDETRGGRIAGCLLWRCKPRRKEILRHRLLITASSCLLRWWERWGLNSTTSGFKFFLFPHVLRLLYSFPASQPMLGCQAYDCTLQVSVYLRRGVSLCCPKIPGLKQSSCLRLLNSWDYRCLPLGLLLFSPFKLTTTS